MVARLLLFAFCLAVTVTFTSCSKIKYPEAYGVYLAQGKTWAPVEQEIHADRDGSLQVLVFDPRVSGGIDPGGIAVLNKRFLIRHKIEMVKRAKSEPPLRYEVFGGDNEAVTASETLPLSVVPVDGHPSTVILKAKLNPGLYRLEALGKELQVVSGDLPAAIDQLPPDCLVDKWYTTADTTGEFRWDSWLEMTQKEPGEERSFHNRPILAVEFSKIGRLDSEKQTIATSIESRLNEGDVEKAIGQMILLSGLDSEAPARYEAPIVGKAKIVVNELAKNSQFERGFSIGQSVRQHWPKAATEVVEPCLTATRAKGEQAISDGLPNTAISIFEKLAQSGFGNSADHAKWKGLLDTRQELENRIKAGVEKVLATREEPGNLVQKWKLSTGFFSPFQEIKLYENALTYQVIGTDAAVWMGELTALTGTTDRLPIGGSDVPVGLVNNSTFHFDSFAARGEFLRAIADARTAWGERWAKERVTIIKAEPGIFGEKVWIEGCRFGFKETQPGDYEVQVDDSSPDLHRAGEMKNVPSGHWIRFRSAGRSPVEIRLERWAWNGTTLENEEKKAETKTASEQPAVSAPEQQVAKDSGEKQTGEFPDQGMPGEKFPFTRTRRLTEADVAGWPLERLQFAINEMIARKGGYFDKENVRRQFENLSWYHPDPTLKLDDIEARLFTETERENFKLLGELRTRLKERKAPMENQEASRAEAAPTPNFVGTWSGRLAQKVEKGRADTWLYSLVVNPGGQTGVFPIDDGLSTGRAPVSISVQGNNLQTQANYQSGAYQSQVDIRMTQAKNGSTSNVSLTWHRTSLSSGRTTTSTYTGTFSRIR